MDKLNILIVDGQGGRIGKLLCEKLKASDIPIMLTAVGTNSIATSSMLKGGADQGATGENSVIVCSRDADIIVGPVGIVIADSLLGEITVNMATAIGQSRAIKLLIPVNKCSNRIIGTENFSLSELIDKTVAEVNKIYKEKL